MKSKASSTRWATAAALVLGLTAAPGTIAAPDDSRCTCWYDGYEDGTEFPPAKIKEAEHYAECAKKGEQSLYEDGFTAGTGHKDRKCPL